jgi:hypothetical protein
VHSITDADEARSAEQHSRIVKYTVSMSVRLACFIGAFFTHGPLQWALLAGAVVLPYFAVIIANGGADRSKKVHSDALLDAPPRWALGAAPADEGVWSGGEGSGAGATAEPDAGASPDGRGTGGKGTGDNGPGDKGTGKTGADGTDGTTQVLLEGELVEDAQQDGNRAESSGPSAADPSSPAAPSKTAKSRP